MDHLDAMLELANRPPFTADDVTILRADSGLSLNDFATVVGTCPEAVWRWETGRVSPSKMANRLLWQLREKLTEAVA
tara:strand:+ start:1438 stop:1668 length:231 start_codon:yes stop_codon:yes gene_type:complete